MSRNPFELWGEVLLEMAKISEGPKAFFGLFRDGYAQREEKSVPAYKQFTETCHKIFGKEGIEEFNELMKEFYQSVGVVPRAQYNELRKKYSDLKERVRRLEETMEELRNTFESGTETPPQFMEQWTKAVRNYTEINKQFFNEFSKFFDN
ncbi:hypothetical protein ACFL0Q_01890 [Thermodesulfobacteriota bacterium]